MSVKGLAFFTANPFHNGHMALVETALKSVDELDVYVGNREKPWSLPREIRVAAILAGVSRKGYSDRVRVLTTPQEARGSILEIGPAPYDTLVMGSDIANKFADSERPFRDYEREHFLSFPSLTVLNRKKYELTEAAVRKIRERVGRIEVHPAVTDLEGTTIRREWKNGGDVRPFLPNGVWEVIAPHVWKYLAQP